MSASGVFDSAQAHEHFFVVSERIYTLVEMDVWLRFRQFWAPATTVVSGGSSTPTTSSGGSSTPTTSNFAAHKHKMFNFFAAGPFTSTIDQHTARDSISNTVNVYFGNGSDADLYTASDDGSHDHTVTVAAHTHTVTVGAHSHSLEFGIYKEAMPATINVNLGVWRKPFTGGAWTLLGSVSGINTEEVLLDLMQVVGTANALPGLWRLTIQSAAGAPQGGRLTVDVSGAVVGAIRSA